MKKILSILALSLGLSLTAMAQQTTIQSFLNVRSLFSTNGANVSNILSFVPPYTSTLYSNVTGVKWTNSSGTLQIVTNTGNYPQGRVQIFKDIPLNHDRNGNPQVAFLGGLSGNSAASLTTNYVSGATLYVLGNAASANNGAVTITLTPVWDSDNALSMGTGDDFTATLPGSSVTWTSLSTNLPLWKWPGATALRVKSVVNANSADAGGVWLHKLQVVGSKP